MNNPDIAVILSVISILKPQNLQDTIALSSCLSLEYVTETFNFLCLQSGFTSLAMI